jgi:CBS domain-containing protein
LRLRRPGYQSYHRIIDHGISAVGEEVPMNVAEVIHARRDVFAIPEEMSVHDAARYLRERKVRAVGVLDGAGKLVGVISQSDISDKVAAENKASGSMKVSEIMTRELITVSPEMVLEECLLRMEKNGIFHLLVVDSQGVFRGMISVTDLLQVIASDQKARADMLESLLFPQR